MIDEIRLLPNEIIGILYSINYFRLNEIRRKKSTIQGDSLYVYDSELKWLILLIAL